MAVEQSQVPFMKKEDTWAMIIALGLTLLTTITFLAGGFGFIKSMAIKVPGWSTDFSVVSGMLTKDAMGIVTLFLFFLVFFTIGAKVMGKMSKSI